VREGDRVVAFVLHDRATLSDPQLLDAVIGLVRVALVNAQLRTNALEEVEELAASRRRLVVAADSERARLRRSLESGPGAQLEHVAALVSDDVVLSSHVDRVRDELRRFGAGLSPRALAEQGLPEALNALADVVPIRVDRYLADVSVREDRGVALYFAAAEAFANVVKYSLADTVTLRLAQRGDEVELSVVDNGVGGADASKGTGLRGLADRMDAVDGALHVASSTSGTTVTARVPAL
jgi:signal transduction histidine kinase